MFHSLYVKVQLFSSLLLFSCLERITASFNSIYDEFHVNRANNGKSFDASVNVKALSPSFHFAIVCGFLCGFLCVFAGWLFAVRAAAPKRSWTTGFHQITKFFKVFVALPFPVNCHCLIFSLLSSKKATTVILNEMTFLFFSLSHFLTRSL